MLHAYKLRAEYEALHPDTTIALPDGTSYPVGQAFADAPDGVLVLDDQDPEQIPALLTVNAYFAAKTVRVPEPARKAASTTDSGADAPKKG